MKFTVTMKNPDCVSQAVEDALFYNPGKEEVIEVAINEWFEYNEYLEVEVESDYQRALLRGQTIGRPLMAQSVLEELERTTGRAILPKKRGRKPKRKEQDG